MSGRIAGRLELERLLARVAPVEALDRRLEKLSKHFLGCPYLENPLEGSHTTAEQLVTRLDGFDCVTFAETVIALARSTSPARFEQALVSLRYRGGRVQWLERNHYMSLWLERNVRSGAVAPVLRPRWETEETARSLCCLEGYPPLERKLEYLPLARTGELVGEVHSGDMICFVSTRDDLDTFHVGLLVARPAPLSPLLRHASRSAAQVVEEPLDEFLDRNETPGVLVARPLPPKRGEYH